MEKILVFESKNFENRGCQVTDIITALFEKEKELKAKKHQLPALVLLKKDGSKESCSWESYLHYHAFSAALALQELKLERDKVKIEVLAEEKKGLFGMPGAKPAKVRISLKKAQERAPNNS